MPRRKNWRKSVCRREVLYGEVSINASPDQLQANGSPAKCRQMEILPNAGKWKSCTNAGKWKSCPIAGKWKSCPSAGKWKSCPNAGNAKMAKQVKKHLKQMCEKGKNI